MPRPAASCSRAPAGTWPGAHRPRSTRQDSCTGRPRSSNCCPTCTRSQSCWPASISIQPPGVAVLDLYCGIGSTLRQWVPAGRPALGIELAGGAVDCARINAPGAVVLRGTCEQRMPQVRDWWRDGKHSRRACYVNPPRSGLEPALLAALAHDLRPDRIAYLSCSAGTLARDLAVFEAAGYEVQFDRAFRLLSRHASRRVPGAAQTRPA